MKTPISRVAGVLTLTTLVACNGSGGGGNGSGSQTLSDGSNVKTLFEKQSYDITPSGGASSNTQVVSWSWSSTPINAGALRECDSADGFDRNHAALRLSSACTYSSQCNIGFEQLTSSDQADNVKFRVSVPSLKAPIGLTYRLEATDDLDNKTVSNITFCLVAINESPSAEDDVYTVTEGRPLVVDASQVAGLLNNDVDDVDVSNRALSVNTTPVREPSLSNTFELFEDGSFNYTYEGDPVVEGGVSLSDSFEYEISDGRHLSTATVTLNIVTVDNPPEQVGDIPEISFIAGVEGSFSLEEFFSDPEGAELSYRISGGEPGPSGELSVSGTGVLGGTATKEDVGRHTLEVSVSDGVSAITAGIELVVVDNAPPRTVTVGDLSIPYGELIRLSASEWFLDPELAPLTFAMTTRPESGLSIVPSSGLITGQLAEPGVYEVTVSASDGINEPVSITFSITQGERPNSAPRFTGSIEDQSITLGETIATITPAFVDPDDDTLVYSITSLPDGLSFNSASGVLSGQPAAVGSYQLAITATDEDLASATSNTFTITVNEVPNEPPTFGADIPDQQVTLGEAMTPVSGEFTDPEGQPLSYSVTGMPTGVSVDEAGVISGTPVVTGNFTMQITAVDDQQQSAVSNAFVLSVQEPANNPPQFNSEIADQSIELGDPIDTIVPDVTDADDDPLTFDSTDLPAGLTLNTSTGVLSGTPTEVGSFDITLSVTDGEGGAGSSNTFTISVAAGNGAPQFGAAIADQSITIGQAIEPVVPEFTDPDGDTLSYATVSVLPAGLTLSSTTGRLAGTPTSLGSYDIQIQAEDPDGLSATSNEFTIVVAEEPNAAPEFNGSIADQSIVLGESITPVVPDFSDPDGDTLAYSPVSAPPAGLALSSTTGRLAGTPTSPGSYDIQIQAEDPDGLSAVSNVFTILVAEAPNESPEFSGPIADQSITLGESIAPVVPDFSDPDGDTLSYASVGTLPAGLTLSATTGRLAGTPQAIGSYDLQISAEDPDGLSATSNVFTIDVGAPPNSAPGFSGLIADQQIIEGDDIDPIDASAYFTDSDSGDTLSYSATGLPDELTINAGTGLLTGTPLAGDYTIVIKATDEAGASAVSNSFTIEVTAANAAPVFTGTIADQSVDEGQAITPVDASDYFSDPGDTLVYAITALPESLTFVAGVLSGAVDTAGTYTLVITATDSAGASTDASGFDIIVVAVAETTNNPPEQTAVIPDFDVEPSESVTIDLAAYFIDDDDDMLSFTLGSGSETLPADLQLSSAGLISGIVDTGASNADIIVSVTDGEASLDSNIFSINVTTTL